MSATFISLLLIAISFFSLFDVNSKQYRKYTTALTIDCDSILTFGLLGRSFQLSELTADDDFDDEIVNDAKYLLLTSIATGLVVVFVIWKLCKN
jgi:hypothetical protein